MLHFTSCGLTNVWLKSGFNIRETRYGRTTAYEDIDGLYRVITLEFGAGTYEITSEVFRFLRKRLELTLDELGAALGYQGQTVANWEKGKSKIPLAAARLARLLCLEKFAPDISVGLAMSKHEGSLRKRIDLQYTDLGWQVVGSKAFAKPHVEEAVVISSSIVAGVRGDFGTRPMYYGKSTYLSPSNLKLIYSFETDEELKGVGDLGWDNYQDLASFEQYPGTCNHDRNKELTTH